MYVQCKIRLSFGLLSWNLEYSFKLGLDLHLGTYIHLGIKIPSFSKQRLLNEENIIQFWEFGIKMVFGVRIRKALQRLLLLILKKYSLPPTRVRLVLLLLPFLLWSLLK